ncbi:hypothetical protein N7537_010282 [Penicillium hordei]|uniref:Uncharacterized protein n=1 Tax=Penicillium hordei TaxID=40994 RepID=A0AAD6DUM6_9EURO|nr:uncharacterized protein N7537_010282 [Penicillium hordei]KAJ5593378.1 hypothetical protein N7537_010282 [Penicillium hordei]
MFIGRIVLGNGINATKWGGKLAILNLGLNVGGYCIANWINYRLSFGGDAIYKLAKIGDRSTYLDKIKFSIAYKKENAIRYRDLLLRSKTNNIKTLHELLLSVVTQAMQQLQALSCFNVFTYWYKCCIKGICIMS